MAAFATGIVAGFMLGHALILGPFLDWLLLAEGPARVGATYTTFRTVVGRPDVELFDRLCLLQVLATLAFFAVALAARRHRLVAAVAAVAGTSWLVVHYASGFAALEAGVLKASAEISRDLAGCQRMKAAGCRAHDVSALRFEHHRTPAFILDTGHARGVARWRPVNWADTCS